MNKTMTTIMTCLLLTSGLALAGGTGGVPALPVATLAEVPVQFFPALDRGALLDEDDLNLADGGPQRFAVPRDVSLTPENSGRWTTAADGQSVWRLRLSCPEALSLNLGFARFVLPEGGQMLFYAADSSGPVLVFDARDQRGHGQLWTPVLLSDEVVVELQVPAGLAELVELELTRVGCGYRFFGEDPVDKSGSCNIDVVCEEGDDWRHEISSIGMYSVSGTTRCSGVMINNTAEDQRPLFLTANHCPVTTGNAPSVVVYWNYESPTCGQQGGGPLDQSTSGSTVLARDAGSDFLLLELDENPDPVFGVTFAGWDRRDAVPSGAVALHHPSTDEKSISFENDPLTLTTYLLDEVPGDSSHLRVENWDLGTTEGGSSGSPIFDPTTHRIVGQLHGGYASCTNPAPDWYGRIFTSWEGGGTPATRLRDHLDPGGTGVQYIDSMGYVPPPPPDPEYMDIAFLSVGPNPFIEETEFMYHLNQDAMVQVRIMNMHGRPVRDYGQMNGVWGSNRLTWDGRDDDGYPVPAGLYFFFIESEGESAHGRVTRLR